MDKSLIITIAIDIVAVAMIVLITIVGIKRGFLKTLGGLITAILTLVVAIFAATPLASITLEKTNWGEKLEIKLEETLAENMKNAYGTILYYDLDSDGELDLAFKPEETNEFLPFNQIIENKMVAKVISTLKLESYLEAVAKENLDENNLDITVSLISVVSKTLTKFIFIAGAFLVITIIARVIIGLLMKLLIKAAESLYVAHFGDKILGSIVGLVFGTLIIFIVLTILQYMQAFSFMNPVNTYLEKTVIVKFFMDNNFLYRLIKKNLTLAKLKTLIKIK